MQKFEDLINKDKYQVFIFCCPAYFPFKFLRHPWFVLNKKGEISRWEIRDFMNKKDSSHLFINNQLPFEGTQITFFVNKKWETSLLGYVDGEVAERAINLIENTKKNYLYYKKYFYTGPNSNTYLQWVLNKFPEFNIKLSWRFIGRDFNV